MKKEAGETDLVDPLVEMPDGKHDYNLKTYVSRYSTILTILPHSHLHEKVLPPVLLIHLPPRQ